LGKDFDRIFRSRTAQEDSDSEYGRSDMKKADDNMTVIKEDNEIIKGKVDHKIAMLMEIQRSIKSIISKEFERSFRVNLELELTRLEHKLVGDHSDDDWNSDEGMSFKKVLCMYEYIYISVYM
jgi:hypothetical protein